MSLQYPSDYLNFGKEQIQTVSIIHSCTFHWTKIQNLELITLMKDRKLSPRFYQKVGKLNQINHA